MTLNSETETFHQHGTFAALWLLVCFVGIEILTKARDILEPLLWAFFLVNILVPIADKLERGLMFIGRCGRPKPKPPAGPAGPASSRASGSNRSGSRTSAQHQELELPISNHRRRTSEGDKDNDSDESDDDGEASIMTDKVKQKIAHGLAVTMVLLSTVGFVTGFFTLVYRSAEHMKEDWHHYKNGSEHMTMRIKEYVKGLPEEWVAQSTEKALTSVEGALFSILNFLLEASMSTALEMLWIGLYMVFWLFQPFHVGREVSTVFRRYVFLKGVASACYATCIWILLHILKVDLAIVFGSITFVLNFIPEIGPFIAMVLPLPVILFDDRMSSPVEYVLLALVGQLTLKFIFGNIVEIKLIESQQEMRMHPVIILFFVAFFQLIWGATGMLLSVPIVAALKATLHKIPPFYRDRILVFLEGDRKAPERWKKWRESLKEDAGGTPLSQIDEE